MAMVRPRPGDFVMDGSELAAMQRAAAEAVEAVAGGIVFGIQTSTGHVAVGACRDLLACCPGVETVFHRAFDFTPDAFEALEAARRPGRQPHPAGRGRGTWATPGEGEAFDQRCGRLRALANIATGRIEILPGGGFRPVNGCASLGVDRLCRAPQCVPPFGRGSARGRCLVWTPAWCELSDRQWTRDGAGQGESLAR
jgi:copper homeostasis protein